MARIEVDGIKRTVVENLGFQHSSGHYAKVVMTKDGERVAVRRPRSKLWRFWTTEDRIKPFREHLARQADNLRYCRCADPENCAQAVPGYVCLAGRTVFSEDSND